MRLTFLRGVTVGAGVVAIAVAGLSATAALAGTGVGAVFNLGASNRVNAVTSLSGSASGPTLRLANSGTGPALALTAGKGKPPLTVNSATQVANLNASLLDGIAAAGFVRGGGQARAFGFTLTGTQRDIKLLTIPGYGELDASCVAGGGAEVLYENVSGATEDVWFSPEAGAPFEVPITPYLGFDVFNLSVATEGARLMVHYTSGSLPLVFQHVATAEIQQAYDASAGQCHFVAQAVAGPGSLAP